MPPPSHRTLEVHDMTQHTMSSGVTRAENHIWCSESLSANDKTVSVDLSTGSFSAYHSYGNSATSVYGDSLGNPGSNEYLTRQSQICLASTEAERLEVQGPESGHFDVPIQPCREGSQDGTLVSLVDNPVLQATPTSQTPWPRSPLYAKLFGDEPFDESPDSGSDTDSLRRFDSDSARPDKSPTHQSSHIFTREVPPARNHTPNRRVPLERDYPNDMQSHYGSGQATEDGFSGFSDQIPIQSMARQYRTSILSLPPLIAQRNAYASFRPMYFQHDVDSTWRIRGYASNPEISDVLYRHPPLIHILTNSTDTSLSSESASTHARGRRSVRSKNDSSSTPFDYIPLNAATVASSIGPKWYHRFVKWLRKEISNVYPRARGTFSPPKLDNPNDPSRPLGMLVETEVSVDQ